MIARERQVPGLAVFAAGFVGGACCTLAAVLTAAATIVEYILAGTRR